MVLGVSDVTQQEHHQPGFSAQTNGLTRFPELLA